EPFAKHTTARAAQPQVAVVVEMGDQATAATVPQHPLNTTFRAQNIGGAAAARGADELVAARPDPRVEQLLVDVGDDAAVPQVVMAVLLLASRGWRLG